MTTTIEKETHNAGLAAEHAGKYLTFCLRQEYYGIPVHKIREIIRMLEVTPVPQMPEYVRGVINLRGKIIPVIDLRQRFDLGRTEADSRTCIVVVQVTLAESQKIQMGMVVDAVEEVVNIGGGDIEKTPSFGSKLRSDYILGMAKMKGKVKTLLDIDRVVAAEALTQLVVPA